MIMEFDFSQEKNDLLFIKRGVTFYKVIEAIAERGILLNFDHPNQQKYPEQKILVVNLDGYAYCVPYVVEGGKWFLKTIYPSRKFRHLIGGSNDG
jgi:hypothetical protein